MIHPRSLVVLLIGLGAVGGAVAASGGQGAIPSDGLTKLVEHALQQPGKRDTQVTFIVESDAPAEQLEAPIAAAGGKLPFHFGTRYEVRISAARLQPLLMRLPDGSRARLPWPHQAVATVISQGVELTGANDMQLLGQTGAGVKIGIIDLQY
jgi:hypothetical protein